MADPPRLAPPPGRGVADVGAQLQQMGLSEGDAQKPLPQDFVWGPEPDDLDAELAMVEKELQQLNELELSMNQAVDVHVGSDPVWAMQQSFEQFPNYTVSGTDFTDPGSWSFARYMAASCSSNSLAAVIEGARGWARERQLPGSGCAPHYPCDLEVDGRRMNRSHAQSARQSLTLMCVHHPATKVQVK